MFRRSGGTGGAGASDGTGWSWDERKSGQVQRGGAADGLECRLLYSELEWSCSRMDVMWGEEGLW